MLEGLLLQREGIRGEDKEKKKMNERARGCFGRDDEEVLPFYKSPFFDLPFLPLDTRRVLWM